MQELENLQEDIFEFPEEEEKYFGFDKEEILEQVQQEYNAGADFVSSKRESFLERLRLYNLQKKSKDKIQINSIYGVMQSLLSAYYTDEMGVSFASRDLGDEQIIQNLENLANFDNEEMSMDKMNYQVQWDRFFYGVGIRVRNGWDQLRKLPIFKVMDPLSWIPDPEGDIISNNFRFHGFLSEVSVYDLTQDKGFFDVDLINVAYDSDDVQKSEIRSIRNLLDAQDLIQNPMIEIYTHYTIIGGEKYAITLANNNYLIIRMQKINPVGEAEEFDPLSIPFPVVLNYYSPLRGDPFGVSVPDLLEDKQRAKSILANLRLIKEKRNTLGGEFLYDPTMIKNKNDLVSPTLGPKYIPVDTTQRSIQSAVYEIPRGSVEYGMIETTLSEQETLSVGFDALSQQFDKGFEKGNLSRFLLGYKINSWGEKAFWQLWHRSYKEFFSQFDSKLIKVSTSFGKKSLILRRGDLIGIKDPDIQINSKNLQEYVSQNQKANFMALYPIVSQDPSIPQVSKKFALRKLYQLNGIPKEQIDILVPQTYEELQAQQDIELINQNIPIDVCDLQEDHMTYIIMYQKAQETEAKYISIENRKKALLESGQLQKTKELSENNINHGIMNMASSQLFSSSNAVQRNLKDK